MEEASEPIRSAKFVYDVTWLRSYGEELYVKGMAEDSPACLREIGYASSRRGPVMPSARVSRQSRPPQEMSLKSLLGVPLSAVSSHGQPAVQHKAGGRETVERAARPMKKNVDGAQESWRTSGGGGDASNQSIERLLVAPSDRVKSITSLGTSSRPQQASSSSWQREQFEQERKEIAAMRLNTHTKTPLREVFVVGSAGDPTDDIMATLLAESGQTQLKASYVPTPAAAPHVVTGNAALSETLSPEPARSPRDLGGGLLGGRSMGASLTPHLLPPPAAARDVHHPAPLTAAELMRRSHGDVGSPGLSAQLDFTESDFTSDAILSRRSFTGVAKAEEPAFTSAVGASDVGRGELWGGTLLFQAPSHQTDMLFQSMVNDQSWFQENGSQRQQSSLLSGSGSGTGSSWSHIMRSAGRAMTGDDGDGDEDIDRILSMPMVPVPETETDQPEPDAGLMSLSLASAKKISFGSLLVGSQESTAVGAPTVSVLPAAPVDERWNDPEEESTRSNPPAALSAAALPAPPMHKVNVSALFSASMTSQQEHSSPSPSIASTPQKDVLSRLGFAVGPQSTSSRSATIQISDVSPALVDAAESMARTSVPPTASASNDPASLPLRSPPASPFAFHGHQRNTNGSGGNSAPNSAKKVASNRPIMSAASRMQLLKLQGQGGTTIATVGGGGTNSAPSDRAPQQTAKASPAGSKANGTKTAGVVVQQRQAPRPAVAMQRVDISSLLSTPAVK